MGNWGKPIKGDIKVPKGGGYNASNGTRFHPRIHEKKDGCALVALGIIALPVVIIVYSIKEVL